MALEQQLNEATPLNDVVVNSVVSNASPLVPGNESVFEMFWRSGLIVKLVMLSLFLASIWSWSIILSKTFKLKRLKAEAAEFEENFWSGTDLESLYREIREVTYDPLSNVFCAAMAEWERLTRSGRNISRSIEDGIERIMRITINKEVDDLEKGMSFLANLGVNGVIIGLLGMVVSCMDGLKTIAGNQMVGLAAVAPIISESLFTTALGLFAAIPAAVAYKKFSNEINRYENKLETFSDEFVSIVSKQVEDA